jgi:hypothetical protein
MPQITATGRQLVLIALVLAAPAMPAHAASCGSVPVSEDRLNGSDVVVIGRITILNERRRDRRDGRQVISGRAEIHAEDVERNRTELTSPFRFTFKYVFDGSCAFGVTVYDGEHALLYLTRLPLRGLKAIDVDYP